MTHTRPRARLRSPSTPSHASRHKHGSIWIHLHGRLLRQPDRAPLSSGLSALKQDWREILIPNLSAHVDSGRG